jgi:DNA polymerase III subunit gamma/tau
MSLDTKYRPITFDEVLGQSSTIKVLRRFVSSGAGFHQSYLFAGPFGSGKTTLGRILGRALLCERPVDGNPCDECSSCRSLLDLGTSDALVEIDAATNSGKAEIKKIVEEIEYSTFSGRKKIYLFDEAHQLSTSALDAMLKPMEENSPGSEDKKLICIFCTTEPEKMRHTILSRCAPAFVIEVVDPPLIADRLEDICISENIPYEKPALNLIAECTDCHIRDALKAVEGVSMLGALNQEHVTQYLHLDLNSLFIDIVIEARNNLPQAMLLAEEALKRVSPTTLYERLAEVCLLGYKVNIGAAKTQSYWNSDKLSDLIDTCSPFLLDFASYLSSKPGRPTENTILCDIGFLHKIPLRNLKPEPEIIAVSDTQSKVLASSEPQSLSVDSLDAPSKTIQSLGKVMDSSPRLTSDGVWVDPRAIRKTEETIEIQPVETGSDAIGLSDPFVLSELSVSEFSRLLWRRVQELEEGAKHGSKRR